MKVLLLTLFISLGFSSIVNGCEFGYVGFSFRCKTSAAAQSERASITNLNMMNRKFGNTQNTTGGCPPLVGYCPPSIGSSSHPSFYGRQVNKLPRGYSHPYYRPSFHYTQPRTIQAMSYHR